MILTKYFKYRTNYKIVKNLKSKVKKANSYLNRENAGGIGDAKIMWMKKNQNYLLENKDYKHLLNNLSLNILPRRYTWLF